MSPRAPRHERIGRETTLTPAQAEAIRNDARPIKTIAADYRIGRNRVIDIKSGLAANRRKLTDDQAADIIADRRSNAEISKAYGVSHYTVANCKNGGHIGGARVLAAREDAARRALPKGRFYEPFRDGTYAR